MEKENNVELQEAFTEYIETVKNLSLIEKKQETIDSLKDLIATIDLVAKNEGIELNYLSSQEIRDISEEEMPEEEYVEALLVYIEQAKNSIGEYLHHKI